MTENRQRRALAAKQFQRLVVVFVCVAVALIAVISYFAFSKTTITITPRLIEKSVEVHVLVAPAGTVATDATTPLLTGTILSNDVTLTETGTASAAAGTDVPTNAMGTVTITNNSGKSQTLRDTTRLLSDGGILFRTQKIIVVPAHSSADVAVRADTSGKEGEIAPSKFEIVALWPGLKTLIYGESKVAFTGGTNRVASVTQEDLNTTRKVLLDKLEQQGRVQIEDMMLQQPDLAKATIVALNLGSRTENPGAAVGDQVTTFSYTMTTQVTAVVMDQAAFDQAVQANVEKALDADYRFLGAVSDQKKISIRDINEEKNTATIVVSTPVKTVVRLSSPIFDRSNLASRDRQEILSHFSQFDSIASTKVHFSPFWVFRAPSLPDHIEIKLLDPVSP